MATPFEFTKKPFGSVLRKSEAETIAANIMVILARTGNVWRVLSEQEYEAERMKDATPTDPFTVREIEFFRQAVPFTVSEDSARTFSPVWAAIPK